MNLKPTIPTRQSLSGLTLLEIMVAVTLLIVIMGGLMAMFDQTQKVFLTGLRQVDVLEGGRAAADLVGRDFEQISAGGRSWDTNFYAQFFGWPSGNPAEVLEPGGNTTVKELSLQEAFFLTHGSNWNAIGYRVLDPNDLDSNDPVLMGALYRYSTNSTELKSTNFFLGFSAAQNSKLISSGQMSRVIDGVVHFNVTAFDSRGIVFTATNIVDELYVDDLVGFDPANPNYSFRGKRLPSAVEVEIGVLEPEAVIRARALPGSGSVYADNFREFVHANSGKIHLFRQRIPIRVAASFGN